MWHLPICEAFEKHLSWSHMAQLGTIHATTPWVHQKNLGIVPPVQVAGFLKQGYSNPNHPRHGWPWLSIIHLYIYIYIYIYTYYIYTYYIDIYIYNNPGFLLGYPHHIGGPTNSHHPRCSGEPSKTLAINMSLAECVRSTRGCWSAWRFRQNSQLGNQDGEKWWNPRIFTVITCYY